MLIIEFILIYCFDRSLIKRVVEKRQLHKMTQ